MEPKMDKEKILQAGKIGKEIKEFAKGFIKKDMPLFEIAEKIEAKIVELGGKWAFPINLSIDNIAAHYTPAHDDTALARGLLKVDLGVHVDGWIADTAFSLDLENSEENKKLIVAAEKAVDAGTKTAGFGKNISEVGKAISEAIKSEGFLPIVNLSGHQIENYELHAGVSVPNMDDGRASKFEEGLYAVEPFASNGTGRIHEGRPSGIYLLIDSKNVRSPIAREMLEYIMDEFQTLPFCERWLFKKFGAKTLFGLKQLEQNGNLHQFEQLVEKEGVKIAQAENDVLVEKDKTIITTI